MTWCRSCCARRARARASSTSPATTTSSCATSTARISAASRWPRTPSMSRRTAAVSSSFTAICSTSSSAMRAGSRCSATTPTTSRSRSTPGSTRSRRLLGLPYWSLSQWVKLKVKNAVNFIGEYERTLTAEARRHRVDGVICGHIHHAVIRQAGQLHLRQLRRLGGKLHRRCRAFRRPPRDHRLGQPADPGHRRPNERSRLRCHSNVIESSYKLKSCDVS